MFTALALLPLLSPAAAPISPSAAPVLFHQDQRLDDKALAGLSEALAAYFAARAKGQDGIDDARAAVESALKQTFPDRDPLSQVADLERAVQLARARTLGSVRTGKVTDAVHAEGAFARAPLEYTYRVPRDYDEKRTYPLILAIPDEGETPPDHLRDFWSSQLVKENAIVVVVAMPEDPDDWHQVMVNALPGGLCHVLTATRIAVENFAVDPDRIFVAGRGAGVAAALHAGNTTPQRFAGIVGLTGDAAELAPDNFGNLPVYLAGGGARATAFVEAATGMGFEHCVLRPLGGELDAWRWMGLSPRKVAPERIRIAVGEPFPVRSGWMRVTPSEVKPVLTARADRKTNTIRLEAKGASRIVLYLNDRLVDLDQPVRVIAGGKEGTTVVPRNLALTLDRLHDGTSDAGCIYTAELVLDLGQGALWPEPTPIADNAEFHQKLATAEGSLDALWALHVWCTGQQLGHQSVSVLRRILRLEPDHKAARAALGHRWSSVQWFTSQAALDRFTASQEPGAAAARGWVEYQGLWMHPSERANLSKGLVKDQETGEWLTSAERKRLANGWKRQDLDWIPPDQTDRIDQGLWRVDGEWVDLTVADRRRANIGSMWHIPGARVRLHATTDRAVALKARGHMELAIEDMRKVFGAAPALPLDVTLLRIEEQFDRFAFGEPDGRRPPSHIARLHLVHNAFFAESWFPQAGGKPSYAGMGVGLWDADYPSGDAYGVHSARIAVGLSYVDALDPSPKATKAWPKDDYFTEFEAEKQLPAWLRWGAAVYAERFYEDTTVPPGGDRWWTRRWSIENMDLLGGLRPLDQVFAFQLDPDNQDDARRLLIEVGLLVAFLVDGECAPVAAAHAELKKALIAGRLRRKQVTTLTEALVAHEAELRAFATVKK